MIQRRPRRLVENAILVRFGVRVVACMEIVGRDLRLADADGFRQHPVQSASPFMGQERAIRLKANDLPERVHARVRSTGRNGCDWSPGNLAQRVFKRHLDGRPVGLPLPSGIRGPVIFNQQLVGGHNPVPDWMGSRMTSIIPSLPSARE